MVGSSFYKLHKTVKSIISLCLILILSFLLWRVHSRYNSLRKKPESVFNFRETPLIFIGGTPRSGTTLVRTMLDAHPQVRCGQETRVVPAFITHLESYYEDDKKLPNRANATSSDIINAAIAAFVFDIIEKHAPTAPRMCNKDPYTALHFQYILELFPNAKFIFMLRDGRAFTHSIITRGVTIRTYVNSSDWSETLKDWNNDVEDMWKQCNKVGENKCLKISISMYQNISDWSSTLKDWNLDMVYMCEQCNSVGEDKCLKVHYELLVLRPKEQLRRILSFLDLEWSDNVLHHESFLNKKDGALLSKLEPSTNQVMKPIYVDSLDQWVDEIPEQVAKNISMLAPMLETIGYDIYSKRPNYGIPEPEIVDALIERRRAIYANTSNSNWNC